MMDPLRYYDDEERYVDFRSEQRTKERRVRKSILSNIITYFFMEVKGDPPQAVIAALNLYDAARALPNRPLGPRDQVEADIDCAIVRLCQTIDPEIWFRAKEEVDADARYRSRSRAIAR